MLDSYIIWNSINSQSLGLILKKEPNYNKPRRKHKVFSIDARNGDVFDIDDAWENVIQEYVLFADLKTLNVSIADECHAIASWLHSTNGYAELRDSYDTTHFRLACLVDEINIENHLNEYITVTVRFNCRPECFLNSGKTGVIATSFPFQITNPTSFSARPKMTITRQSGSKDSYMMIGGSTSSAHVSEYGTLIAGTGYSTIYVDCDKRQVSSGSSYSNYIKFESSTLFPMLGKGNNYISFSTNSTYDIPSRVQIYPYWWEL